MHDTWLHVLCTMHPRLYHDINKAVDAYPFILRLGFLLLNVHNDIRITFGGSGAIWEHGSWQRWSTLLGPLQTIPKHLSEVIYCLLRSVWNLVILVVYFQKICEKRQIILLFDSQSDLFIYILTFNFIAEMTYDSCLDVYTVAPIN